MKKHLIPILIIVLLLLSGLFLVLGALMLYELGDGIDHMAGTTLLFAAMMPCLYGPAVALLIPLHRKDRTVPQVYAWLGVISFVAAVIGVGITTVGYYAIFLQEIEPWMQFFWAAWGLLLPFFVSSVVHLRGRAPAERGQTLGKVMVLLIVCLSAALLIGGGLYLHKMSEPHLLNVPRTWAMYERLQRRIADDEPWETVDRVTIASAGETGSDPKEKELEGEERAAAVRLCRELVRPFTEKRENGFFGWVLPDQKAHFLRASPYEDIMVAGETYHVSQCSLTEYNWTGAKEVQVEYTQGETQHTVTLYWPPDPEE